MYLITLISSALVGASIYFLCRYYNRKAANRLNEVLDKLSKGDTSETLELEKQGNFVSVAQNINKVISNLRSAARFSEEIGSGNFTINYESASETDSLGQSLAGMLNRLQEVSEQDKVRRWSTEGLAHFSEIFRSSTDDLIALSRTIIVELVNYMNVNQGGFFIFNDDDPEEPILELTACYAYSRSKYMEKNIPVGDGLIGQAYLEKETIYMTEVPQYYTEITSGLGEATPSSILIVPLKINEQVEGVIEIAAFEDFKPYQIEFVEKLAESIAATITAVKTNAKTRKLLIQSQEQAERMRLQEEEMRQKNEELETSQEELKSQKIQLETILKESKTQEASLTSLINNTTDLIVTIDTKYDIQIFNEAFEKYYSPESDESETVAFGVNILQFYPDNYKIAFQNDFDKALKGERFHVQRKMISKGSFFIYDIYYSPIESETGEITGVAVYSKEVTEYIKKNEEIRRTQQEIAQQAQQLSHNKEAVNRSGVATVEFDMDGYVLDANEAFLKIMKYDDLDEILGESHEIFMPPQQLNSKVYKNFWNRLRNGESSSAQYERITKTGETVWLAGSYNVVTEVNGRAIMVIQVGFDVTETVELIYKTMHQGQQLQMAQNEAKKQVDELHLQKAKQEAIVNALADGIIQFDARGNVEYCNRASETLLNIQKENIIGQSIQNFLPITVALVSAKHSKICIVYSDGQQIEWEQDQQIQIPTQHDESISINLSLKENILGDQTIYTVFLQNGALQKASS